MDIRDIVQTAWKSGIAVPGFNIPYRPMMEPVVCALRDARSFGLIMVARLEWIKFQAGGVEAIREEYERLKDLRHTRLHLDHVPVIDDDGHRVDFEEVFVRAIRAGYDSVMVDGSRLPLNENIGCTRRVVDMAHAAGIPVEAELGAIMGHEAGPLPPYEELFASGGGFTDPDEAAQFVRETGVDWLSVAIGNIHGAISKAKKDEKKIEARLNIDHLCRIAAAARVPLVLHGGTGIRKEHVLQAIRHGVAKVNVATAIRQPYERLMGRSVAAAQEAVYETTVRILREELEVGGSAEKLLGEKKKRGTGRAGVTLA